MDVEGVLARADEDGCELRRVECLWRGRRREFLVAAAENGEVVVRELGKLVLLLLMMVMLLPLLPTRRSSHVACIFGCCSRLICARLSELASSA